MKTLKTLMVSIIVYGVSRLLFATYRVRLGGAEHRQAAEAAHPGGSFCFALWHEYLFTAILAHKGQRFAPLASLSTDGDIVTFVMRRLGFRPVRGSSSRGGEAARNAMVDLTAQGWFTAVTVDGPRGPRRQIKGGVVDVARRTGIAIVPLVALGERQWVLRSWDQFKIPKPFTRVVVRYGLPVTVPPETNGLAFGAAKLSLKRHLDDAEAAAAADLAAWAGGA